jgi:selenocysteine-specific translation elongation factor
MKKSAIVIAFLLGIGCVANAQKVDKDPLKRAHQRAEYLKIDLNLNEEQYAKVLKLNSDITAKREVERVELKAKRKADKAAYDASMKSILNKEQFAEYEAKQALRKKKMEERNVNVGARNRQRAPDGHKRGPRRIKN